MKPKMFEKFHNTRNKHNIITNAKSTILLSRYNVSCLINYKMKFQELC